VSIDNVAITVGQVLSFIDLVVKATGTDKATVIQLAKTEIPALAALPRDAGAAYDAVVGRLERDDDDRVASTKRDTKTS